ncbi:serine--tRNA ligase [Anaplasma bovis]|uniref:serine--tRNA ligase n=1 Tax=Anaplasma bovis TaxID=186733 RepID=UPI002FEF823F
MHDIEFIRRNPSLFDEAMKARGLGEQAAKILELDAKKRQRLTELQHLREQRNALSKEVTRLKQDGADCTSKVESSKDIANRIVELEECMRSDSELSDILRSLPNIPDAAVPLGVNEENNVEIRVHGKKRHFSFDIKPHYTLGEELNMMNFRRAAMMSGSRFSLLSSKLAKMERSLAHFMLEMHTKEFGYTEVFHPSLVNEQAMYNVGQLPKFTHDSFKTVDDFRLVPTSEVVLTNLVADTNLPSSSLPLRYTAYSQCFRAEAGSAGLDTRGMIRQHQFSKVELVSITEESQSSDELVRMLHVAEEVLKRLELPYRIIMLCTGDMGFSASVSYDIEVWMPAQNKYREISSCSNCKDFQARRMGAKCFRTENQKKLSSFVHTLNGSALAIGRTIAAIMENYQNADGSVTVPNVLREYLGTDLITPEEHALP